MYATGAQPYIVTVPPAAYPLTVDEVKQWLKLPLIVVEQDAVIQSIIAGVTDSAEQYTKRDFITRTYETYRDVFGDPNESPIKYSYNSFPFTAYPYTQQNNYPVTIRRSPLQSIELIEYTIDGVVTVFPSTNYRIINKDAWSNVIPITDTPFANSGGLWAVTDNIEQGIKITFKSGYGDDSTFIPANLKEALLMHCAFVYKNRGDCSPKNTAGGAGGSTCSCSIAPAEVIMIYDLYRIVDFVI